MSHLSRQMFPQGQHSAFARWLIFYLVEDLANDEGPQPTRTKFG